MEEFKAYFPDIEDAEDAHSFLWNSPLRFDFEDAAVQACEWALRAKDGWEWMSNREDATFKVCVVSQDGEERTFDAGLRYEPEFRVWPAPATPKPKGE